MNVFSRSLRLQIVVWNALTLTALLAVLGIVTRFAAGEAIQSSVDQQLRERAKPPHRPPRDSPPPAGFPGPDGGRPPDGSPPDSPPPDPPPGPQDEHALRLFDLQGQPRRFNAQGPWDPAALAAARLGRPGFSTVTVQGVSLRILTQATPGGYVQAAYPMTEVSRTIAGLDHALLLLIPVALLGAGLAGAGLTARVLRPVRGITEAAAAMGEMPSARLPIQGEDEFGRMADTFNGLLSRLEVSFRRQTQALEQQRQFTADASHELKSPLTVIQGTASQISAGGLSELESRQAAAEIAEAADSMAHLVRDLLLLARADEGRLGRGRISILASEVLMRSLARVRREGSSIALEIAEDSLTLNGNEDEMIRLFANLLQNSAQATPPGGKISVSAWREKEEIVVAVADTGTGIAPEHLAHLGERFYRTDFARARRDGGTGLGLSICRGIVDAHGGTLQFASIPGVTTTATVRLPTRIPLAPNNGGTEQKISSFDSPIIGGRGAF